MNLEIKNIGDILLVKIFGDFDLELADHCRREIDRNYEKQAVKNILFDLTGISFIDSSGLGVILGRYRRVKENEGNVVIASGDSRIIKILNLSGITRLIPVYPNTAQALKYLAGKVM
ncbi:MAG: STAS domain-containing protein [Thermacetogeniaceae bacterium]|nr:anti-sigma factor antagonist [Thermoanaerobacterales bacterium]NLN20923.1 anti-sigma factor antagonist [Syntrophomonadaceae bacterium]